METLKSDKRIALFDNIKFLLMLFVVIGHFAEVGTGKTDFFKSAYVFIYAFHMPLFIFVSGMMHKNEKILRKVMFFISLGFISKIVIYAMRIFVNGTAVFKLLSDAYIPWFMFVMAMYILLSYLLRNVNKYILLAVSVVAACAAGYNDNIGDFLYLSRAIVFYPCFVLGQIISADTIKRINHKKIFKVISIVIILTWAALCIFDLEHVYNLRPLFTGRNPFSEKEIFEEWGFLYRLLCYGITILTSFAIVSLTPDRRIPAISEFGERTLQVYIWHAVFLLLLKKTGLQAILLATPEGRVIWILTAVLVTFISSLKIFAFPVKQLRNFYLK